jgi:hypothetical protein
MNHGLYSIFMQILVIPFYFLFTDKQMEYDSVNDPNKEVQIYQF